MSETVKQNDFQTEEASARRKSDEENHCGKHKPLLRTSSDAKAEQLKLEANSKHLEAEMNEESLNEHERKFMRLLERVQSQRLEDQRAHFSSERSKKKVDRQASDERNRSSPSKIPLRCSKSSHKISPQPKPISLRDTTFFEALVDSQVTSRYNDQRCSFSPKLRLDRCKMSKKSGVGVDSSNFTQEDGEMATSRSLSSAVSNDSNLTTKPKDSSSTPSTSASIDPSCFKPQEQEEAESDENNDFLSLIWRLQSSRLNDQRARLPNRDASASNSNSNSNNCGSIAKHLSNNPK